MDFSCHKDTKTRWTREDGRWMFHTLSLVLTRPSSFRLCLSVFVSLWQIKKPIKKAGRNVKSPKEFSSARNHGFPPHAVCVYDRQRTQVRKDKQQSRSIRRITLLLWMYHDATVEMTAWSPVLCNVCFACLLLRAPDLILRTYAKENWPTMSLRRSRRRLRQSQPSGLRLLRFDPKEHNDYSPVHIVIDDRSEARHHLADGSGLERESQPNCRPDFSTPLRSGRNDKDSAALRAE